MQDRAKTLMLLGKSSMGAGKKAVSSKYAAPSLLPRPSMDTSVILEGEEAGGSGRGELASHMSDTALLRLMENAQPAARGTLMVRTCSDDQRGLLW